MHEWMKNEGFKKLTKWSDLDIGQKVEGREIYVREKSLGWEKIFCREREGKNEIWFAHSIYKEISSRWIEVSVEH